MKTQEPKNEWEEEIKEIAPWLPLNGSFFEKKEAPKGYFEEFEKHLKEKIKPITKKGGGLIRLKPLLAMAAGFLLLISIGIYYWSNVTANKKDVEYDISTLSTEEAALWLSEEAIISELDLQIYVDNLTLTELQK